MVNINIWCDGGANPNPGPGGYGIVVEINRCVVKMYQCAAARTTNNEQELSAILHAIEIAIKNKNYYFTIYTDSQYSVNSINHWMMGWKGNGWLKGNSEPIKNLTIIQQIYNYYIKNDKNWQVVKCKGHDGILYNEIADALASRNQFKFFKIHKENQKFFYNTKVDIIH